MSKAIDKKLSRAKASLVLQQPFFASLLLRMPMVCDPSLPGETMATNGQVIKYHPKFIEECDHDELVFVLCHEVLHGALQHVFRRGSRDPKKWNAAGDFVINDLLIRENIGRMPKGGLHNPALVQAGGGHAEGVYNLLPDGGEADDGDEGENGQPQGRPQYQNSDGSMGQSFDDMEDAPGTPAEQAAAEAEMKVAVAQAAQAAKMHGKLSQGLRKFVDEALKPVVDWREILRRFIESKAKNEASFARPKRRWLCEDIILPSLQGEDMGRIIVAVDCSGSTMVPHIINAFSGEMRAIHEDVRPETVDVIYWDTRILGHDTFGRDDELKIEFKGGGGTTFSQVVDYIRDHDLNPVCMVVLTDLYIGEFGPPLDFPVLWVSNGADKAPWGEVVMMDKRTL